MGCIRNNLLRFLCAIIHEAENCKKNLQKTKNKNDDDSNDNREQLNMYYNL